MFKATTERVKPLKVQLLMEDIANKANLEVAAQMGLTNIVFNKIVGSLKNMVSSKNMQTRLIKWRSGIEATIFNC